MRMILVIILWTAIIAVLARMRRRPDSSIIELNTEQKNMTATRHDTNTLNPHPTYCPTRSQGVSAGAFA